MLRHIHFLVSRSLKGRCEAIEQQRQRLDFRDSATCSVAVPAAIPRLARFATASAWSLQL
jgi:hypothetical protein